MRFAGLPHGICLSFHIPCTAKTYQRYLRDPAWQVLTSAAADERALDALANFGARDDRGEHSPFAQAIFTALTGEADLSSRQGGLKSDGVINGGYNRLGLQHAAPDVGDGG